MRQKIQDLWTLLQKDRKTQVIAGVIVLAAIFLTFADGSSGIKRTKAKKQEVKIGSGAMGSTEAADDIMTALSKDLRDLKSQNVELATRMNESEKKSEEYVNRSAEIFKRILERMAETESTVLNSTGSGGMGGNIELGNMPGQQALPGMNAVSGGPGSAAKVVPPPGSQRTSTGDYITPKGDIIPAALVQENYLDPSADTEPAELETFGLEAGIVKPPPVAEKEKLAVVGAGDSVRVKLLAGVNAPTDGTPYPVVFKLISEVYGPDGSALPLGEARLIAAAQGSLADSRALFRLSSLNLRLPDGRRKVIPVDGWVVGEDGIRGMEGVLIDPLGKAILGAGIAGGIDGIGKAFSDSQVTTTNTLYGTQEMVTGSEIKYAEGRALSEAAAQWGDIIKQRMDLLVPHVEVLSGREATAVFSKTLVIKDLYNQLADDSQHFASVD